MDKLYSSIFARQSCVFAEPLREIFASTLRGMHASRRGCEVEKEVRDTGKGVGATFGVKVIEAFEIG